MNNVIQTVGSYAGLVALLGLVVLSLLCFSQARDIRRLREWAGGAPERDAEVRELSEIVAEERSQELRVLAEREQRRIERTGYDGGFWDRLGRPGRIMVILAAVIVLGAGAAWAGTSLLGDDGDGGGGGQKAGKARKQGGQKQGGGGLKPSQIRVGVLNGTGGTETGLAAQYADVLERKGYDMGAVGDAPEVFSTSIVMYLKGNEAAARKVAKAIDTTETGLMTSEVAELTPGAMVTAVIGTDHAGLPAGG